MKNSVSRLKVGLVGIFGIIALSVAVLPAIASAQPAQPSPNPGGADGGCRQSLLGFPAWYKGLVDSNCDIRSPATLDPDNPGNGLSTFIWRIVLNIVEILLRLAGFAAVAFIIYGGYKYMLATGSPDGMVAARKTILNAVVGLIISVAAVAIVRTVSNGIGIGG